MKEREFILTIRYKAVAFWLGDYSQVSTDCEKDGFIYKRTIVKDFLGRAVYEVINEELFSAFLLNNVDTIHSIEWINK